LLQDVTTSALHATLRGLAARQRVIADNVANLETPGYLAGRVEFESTLQRALESGADAESVTPTVVKSLAPTGMNGNNVSLDQETLALAETNLRYQLGIESVNNKLGLLRTAIRGQAG
jgi:flagellar basal-body rod protein FlgB